MKLSVINTGFFKLDGGAMFGVIPKVIWDKLNPADENNLCTWSMRCLLIETDDKKILIDNGMGNKQSEKFFSYYEPHGEDTLGNSLVEIGLVPEDITDVILSHLHFDHCGGSVKYDDNRNLLPTFPNATYWSCKTQWESAIEPNDRERASFLRENLLPLQEHGVLKFVDEEDMVELFPGVNIWFVYGHTDAMMIPFVTINGKTIVYMADLIPSSWHIGLPYIMSYDLKSIKTLGEKTTFLNDAVTNGYYLFFEHDPKIECATVKEERGKFSMDKAFKLSEIIN